MSRQSTIHDFNSPWTKRIVFFEAGKYEQLKFSKYLLMNHLVRHTYITWSFLYIKWIFNAKETICFLRFAPFVYY